MEMTDLVRSIVREELENIIQENAETEEAERLEKEEVEQLEFEDMKNTVIVEDFNKLDLLLAHDELKGSQRVYRGFYFDTDIIEFLDNVKHGNKSDIVNEAIRTALKQMEVLK